MEIWPSVSFIGIANTCVELHSFRHSSRDTFTQSPVPDGSSRGSYHLDVYPGTFSSSDQRHIQPVFFKPIPGALLLSGAVLRRLNIIRILEESDCQKYRPYSIFWWHFAFMLYFWPLWTDDRVLLYTFLFKEIIVLEVGRGCPAGQGGSKYLLLFADEST